MAVTAYTINDPLAVKLWSRKLFQESLKQAWVSRFIGKDSSSLLQMKTELGKGPGDQATIALRMLLSGKGTLGDQGLEGQEEALTTYSFNFRIDQLRHAVRSAGKMSEKRVPFSVREEARQGLQDWWADRLDTAFFNQICGNTAARDNRMTGNQPVESVNKENVIYPNNKKSDQTLVKDDVFTLSLIDAAVEKAKTQTPALRPIKIGGADKYVMFLHPYQVTDLKNSSQNSQWMEIQKAALAGGKIKDNPIYTGALGEYNGVILHEAPRVTEGVNAETDKNVPNVRRAVLCGSQAAVIAFSKNEGPNKMSWIEETFDYENQFGVSSGMIFGLKRTKFNNKDFGTIILPTYAAAH